MSDDYELELSIAEENEFPEALQHPSIARIKEGEGIPVMKGKPLRLLRNKENENKGSSSHDVTTDSSRSNETQCQSKFSRTKYLVKDQQKDGATNFENMTLSQVIAAQGSGERTSGLGSSDGHENMSLEDIIRRKKEVEAKDCDKNDAYFKRPTQIKRTSLASRRPMKSLEAKNDQNRIGGSKEVTYTPQSGIRMLCELGYVIVVECCEMKDESHELFHDRRWRVRYFDGRDTTSKKIVGLGEAPRKSLAKESAALDFLEKMQVKRPDLSIPKCEVPKGCRINPCVLVAVENICLKAEIPQPFYSEDVINFRGRDKYQFTVIVGEHEFKEHSYDYKYARYGACKKAFDALNEQGREFTYDEIIKGDDCLDVEYGVVESEELHIVHANTAPPRMALGLKSCSFSASSSPTPWNEMENDGETSGRDSPDSCGSSNLSTKPKRIKMVPVGEYSLPPSLEKIRRRMENRRLPLNSELDKAANNSNNIQLSNSEDIEVPFQSCPPTVSLSGNGAKSAKRTIDGLPKPMENITITVSADLCDEGNLENLHEVYNNTDNTDTPCMDPSRATICNIWQSELRKAVLTDLEPWKDFAIEEEFKEVKEHKDQNPFQFQPQPKHHRFENVSKQFVHQMTLKGLGFGKFFRLSDVGAKLSSLKSFRTMNKLVDAEATTGGVDQTSDMEEEL